MIVVEPLVKCSGQASLVAFEPLLRLQSFFMQGLQFYQSELVIFTPMEPFVYGNAQWWDLNS